jgi:hypothetical protein
METQKVKRWLGSRDKCDICGCDITKKPFVDGATSSGPWALMCCTCHRTHGRGIGPGKGQKYDKDGIKVGG